MGLFPLFPLQLQLESLLLSLFQAVLLSRRYHILPLIWLHSCGKWNDSQFWDDFGIFWKRCCMKCWATRKPIFSWELSRQASTPRAQIRHYAVVFVVVVVLPCSLMSRHQEVLLVMLEAFSHISNCCIPSKDPFVQAHTSCCGIIKSWWSPETEPGTPAGKWNLCTPCAAHSPFLT